MYRVRFTSIRFKQKSLVTQELRQDRQSKNGFLIFKVFRKKIKMSENASFDNH